MAGEKQVNGIPFFFRQTISQEQILSGKPTTGYCVLFQGGVSASDRRRIFSIAGKKQNGE
jgi:hypothetical protein